MQCCTAVLMHAWLKKLEENLGWEEPLEPLPQHGWLGGGIQLGGDI